MSLCIRTKAVLERDFRDGCLGRLCPNDEGSMSLDDTTLKAGIQAKPPQGWAIGGIFSVVHGAVGSPSGHCLLTAHHLDRLWASWGFSGSEKVRSSLYPVGIPLKGSQLKDVLRPSRLGCVDFEFALEMWRKPFPSPQDCYTTVSLIFVQGEMTEKASRRNPDKDGPFDCFSNELQTATERDLKGGRHSPEAAF
ncbi:hypothetical protein Q8A67_024145 [Cirrhinus molitorella]|uniref:Uncharacterized protein n=1 Tax=Cirrhinus molitorella TaxID=172907 RepID=A0AA88PC11_9TELE|nr:hypothetical protein Q8A67_024145 [Cirrhinus molitorella]